MKKSLIALAVAGALAVPMVAQADATIYGEYVGYVSNADGGDLNIENDTIELGVKGTVDNGIDGIETGYNFLFEVGSTDIDLAVTDTTTTTIKATGTASVAQNTSMLEAYAYISGDFGTVTLGTQGSPADIGEDAGEQGGEFNQGGDEVTALSYMTPEMGGFWAAVAFTADGDDTTDSATNTHVGLGFSADGFGVAVGVEDAANAETRTIVTGTYEADAYSAFVNFQDNDTAVSGDADYWNIGGSYAATDAVSVYAEFGVQDQVGSDAKQTLIGASYGMGDAYVALEYSAFNDVAETNGAADTVLFAYGLEF